MADLFISKEFKRIPVDAIMKNPYQPRRVFDPDGISELAASIRTFGVITPLTVRRTGSGFELVAGERRLRAAKEAGLKSVPCYIVETDGRGSSLMAIVENIQRRDLDFFEEAQALRSLTEKYGLTQQQAAEKTGRTQSAVANKLRLLKLSPETVAVIRESGLSERHARALLRLPEESREEAAREIAAAGLNVERTEKYVEKLLAEKKERPKRELFFIKDVRIFLNTLSRAAEIMRGSGVDVRIRREQNENGTVVTVTIPGKRKSFT